MVSSNLGAFLYSVGRYEEALESFRRAVAVSPFGPSPLILGNQFQVLLVLGRLDEARQVGSRLTGSPRLGAPMWLAVAGGEWAAAESLAASVRNDVDAYDDLRLDAEWIRAAALASRGQVRAADQALRAVQARSEFASDPLNVNRTRWRRLMLALFRGGVAAAPREPGHWDSTTTGLVTRGAWAAAAGDTVTARRLLETVRGRSAPDRWRQGFTLQLLQGWIAARAGRWQEVVEVVGPAATQGQSMGFATFQAAPLTRWLVAEAYEHLGQPDSAAAYFERAIALPPAGGSDFAHTRMAAAFGHRRLALLYARMWRADEARDHWQRFFGMMSSPDPEMAPMVQEARAALAGGGGSSKSAIR